MKRYIFLISCVVVLSVSSLVFFVRSTDNSRPVEKKYREERLTPTPTLIEYQLPPSKYVLNQSRFVSQTFNNCGPASLSMVMSMLGKDVSQQELASIMRPFNNPAGGVDDKSIFAHEFVTTAQNFGFESVSRPNGNEDLLKKFVANDIPVVVRTWLHPNEDIGHFRIVRGYDDERSVFIQDDSYEGPHLEYSYDTFMQMWKPFNYGYILVFPKEKSEVVRAILGEEWNEQEAWENAKERAEQEIRGGSSDSYSSFNLATALYYLGNYNQAVETYERISSQMPPRMLWYQYEIIDAYLKTKQYDRVLSIATDILNRGNLAYTEMYLFRGYVYQEQGDLRRAREEFNKALYYNKNSKEAQSAVASLANSPEN